MIRKNGKRALSRGWERKQTSEMTNTTASEILRDAQELLASLS